VKGVLCVLTLFALTFAASAERHSDIFYNVLLSPFMLTGLPGDPSYAVYFGVALVFLISVTIMTAVTAHRGVQAAGFALWVPYAASACWVLYRSDWHPFTTRLSLGIVLTLLFAAGYFYWTYLIIAPFLRGLRKVQDGTGNPASPGG
jgi:hypothetical protein